MNRLIGSALGVLLVTTATLAAQDQTIRRPENLPDPVGEDQRVQASDNLPLWPTPTSSCLTFGSRGSSERARGYINIPLAELEERLDELPKDKTILTA